MPPQGTTQRPPLERERPPASKALVRQQPTYTGVATREEGPSSARGGRAAGDPPRAVRMARSRKSRRSWMASSSVRNSAVAPSSMPADGRCRSRSASALANGPSRRTAPHVPSPRTPRMRPSWVRFMRPPQKRTVLPPNGSRLSCGAERQRSQREDYLRRRGAGSFRRVLGGAAASCGGSPTQEQVEGEKRWRHDEGVGEHTRSQHPKRQDRHDGEKRRPKVRSP